MIIPVILCGGAGSRLWPVSRETHPKPFMRLADGQSLLQKAFMRGAALPGVREVLTVTNLELFFKTKEDFRQISAKGEQAGLPISYVLEPFGRNTAAAVAAAALQVQRTHGDAAVMLILAADHLINDQAAFAAAVAQAQVLAQQGRIVTFGIHPESPETGFGYIQAQGNTVTRFVEKPDFETAKQYLATGGYFWNSGMFCFTAGAILREMAQHCPAILEATQACLKESTAVPVGGGYQVELHAPTFAKVPDDSIDYAVMEKTQAIAMVPCQIGWSDIGSWAAVGELAVADGQGNRVEGHALMHNATGCFVQSAERMVGVVGVSDLIIIDTPDALLVANRNNSQDVKQIYSQLKAQGHESHKLHRTVQRPWGSYTILGEGNGFKIKRIEVKPNAKLSLQMHHHRSEHWIVVSGTAAVQNGDEETMLHTNQSTYIPAGHQHRLHNPGVIDLVMIEVQSGQYLGEDDIVRFSDQYGRV
ncbi:MAG: mannose-1-phosphate guanylyltransferase/mannose-6-phosphate isomerase [Pseudomonadota bacterium]